jgi:predicted metal-binding membrane protein
MTGPSAPPRPERAGEPEAQARAIGAFGARRVRPQMAVLVAVAAVWLALLAASTAGRSDLVHLGHDRAAVTGDAAGGDGGHAGHDQPADPGARPPWATLVAFFAVWELMIMAMMLPSALSMIGLHASASAAHARPAAARVAFLAGYGAVWTVFGAFAFAGDVAVHRLVGASSWLSARPWMVAGALLMGAGAAQFLPLTQTCLRSCRHPYAWLLSRFRPGVGSALRLGMDHGLYCLGCCWALMLTMFAVGAAHLVWMAALTALMVYEKTGRRGQHAAAMTGVALMVWGAVVMLRPSWVVPTVAGMS